MVKRESTLRAVYLTPHHQYPTTATLGAGRRLKLLDLARRHRLTVVEDDYDHEYRFEGRPVLPIAARAEVDLSWVYVGSLSKLLAAGIRIGYAVAKPAILNRMAHRRETIDRQGDLPLEQALAGLIDDGILRRHVRKVRRIYQARRDCLAEELRRKFGQAVEFTVPAGGLALWLRLDPALNAEAWAARAAAVGLTIMPGANFMLGSARAPEAFRIGYASLDEADLRHAVGLLARARADFAVGRRAK
jgi:GntR family transcriptional regulator / MocR family aminotransferase